MIRIYCDTNSEADAVWRLWLQADEPCQQTAELWVNGQPVALLTCGGDPLSAPRVGQPADTDPLPSGEGC